MTDRSTCLLPSSSRPTLSRSSESQGDVRASRVSWVRTAPAAALPGPSIPEAHSSRVDWDEWWGLIILQWTQAGSIKVTRPTLSTPSSPQLIAGDSQSWIFSFPRWKECYRETKEGKWESLFGLSLFATTHMSRKCLVVFCVIKKKNYCSIVAWPYCVSFYCTAKWISYTYKYIPPFLVLCKLHFPWVSWIYIYQVEWNALQVWVRGLGFIHQLWHSQLFDVDWWLVLIYRWGILTPNFPRSLWSLNEIRNSQKTWYNQLLEKRQFLPLAPPTSLSPLCFLSY